MDLAHEDLTAATTMLQVRRLAGSEAAIAELQAAARGQWRRRSRHWLHTLRLDIEQRHEAAGDVAYLLEPDIKDGQGGLRDVQSVHWALATEATAIHDALERPVKALVPHQRLLIGVAPNCTGPRDARRTCWYCRTRPRSPSRPVSPTATR